MEKKAYRYFCNKECEYFPCHKNVEEDEFNCMFCYCPLYGLKDKCGGNFIYLENGIKSCINCGIPHSKKGYEYIMSKSKEMMELGKKDK